MTFILTKKTAVGDLKKQFASEFGGTLRIYEGRSEALEASRLIDIAATIGKVEFLGTMTVGECIAQIQENLNLKVKVYTSDNKVALPDEITLAVIKEIPAGATKTDVAKFAGEAPAVAAETEPAAAAEVAAEPVSEAVADDYPTYEECVAKYKPEEIGTAYTLSKDNKTMTLKDDFEGVLVIPDGVTAVVGNKDGYKTISAVIMPDSVASYTVESSGVEFIRFSHNLTEISSDTFRSCKVRDLIIPKGVERLELSNMNNLIKLTVPEGVKRLRLYYMDNLIKLTLPEGVEKLDIYKNRLTELVVPEGVESLKLSNMDNLTTLILPSTLKELNVRELPLLMPLDLPKGIEKLKFSCMNWEKLVVPEGVKTISGGDNENMTELILPSTLEEIDDWAFNDQLKLKSVVIPANVKIIRSGAFGGCESLEQIVFEGNPEIEDEAFYDCPGYGYKKEIEPLADDSAIYFVINSEPRAIEEDDADMVEEDPYNFYAYCVYADPDWCCYGVYRGDPHDLEEEFGVSADYIEIFDMYAGEYDNNANYPNEYKNKNVFLPEWLYEICNEGFEYIDENPIIQAIHCSLNKTYSRNWSLDRVKCILLDKYGNELTSWYLRQKSYLDD